MDPATPPRSRQIAMRSTSSDHGKFHANSNNPNSGPKTPSKNGSQNNLIPVTPSTVRPFKNQPFLQPPTQTNNNNNNNSAKNSINSPFNGLKSPEFSPFIRRGSLGMKNQLNIFHDNINNNNDSDKTDLQGISKILFPSSSNNRLINEDIKNHNSQSEQNTSISLLPPSNSTSPSVSASPSPSPSPLNINKRSNRTLLDQLQQEQQRPDDRSFIKSQKTVPGTPSDKIITDEQSRLWNNVSNVFATKEIDDDDDDDDNVDIIAQDKNEIYNPFMDSHVPTMEERAARRAQLLAEDPDIENTITFVNKRDKSQIKKYKLSNHELERFKPRMLFENELYKNQENQENQQNDSK
ncbi:cyclin-dependent protein serine/threonine kinase inhibiting protein SIC1 NDAI_0C06620 [Naumovozyma dairenensis CBS 421]|uniref:Uncharacterized protein n=1 Tax=Naumovozyma dairenensis (strain ATCC 10597 / BCRC 20456 / CBS 421 / NBRC 0211 / NRRL Y-12639) TaxID=1071378 RepID=G0W960_NAUDC|nr:hypothetical protein NDAI_0C06620 [Naumovozyma dairenensis CBS 421]CCD24321.1 hypothetical protein NDAI_0C06620 [Naumovozyma dairenensis CBS 421]